MSAVEAPSDGRGPIVTVVGARPQFVKAAVVSRALAARGLDERIVHTGQHYDHDMSGRLLAQLGIERVDANLSVGSGGHSHQTARIMAGLDDYIASLDAHPAAVLVYGDTNSTLAAALVAAKRHLPLVHVEAGLRSGDRAMPEEVNRVVTDSLADVLLCSSSVGVARLAEEGRHENVHDVGDVMLDAFRHFMPIARQRAALPDDLGAADDPLVVATVHRPSNTDDPAALDAIIEAFGRLGHRVVWPVHPRLQGALEGRTLPPNVLTLPPLGYLEMLALLDRAVAVLTDSGGLQKEAHWARTPCTTLRDTTEWTETLEGGWNVLCDPRREDVPALALRTPKGPWRRLYGDGKASERIAAIMAERL